MIPRRVRRRRYRTGWWSLARHRHTRGDTTIMATASRAVKLAMLCAWAAATRLHVATEQAPPPKTPTVVTAPTLAACGGRSGAAGSLEAGANPVAAVPRFPTLPVELWWLVFAHFRDVDWMPV